MVLFGSIKVFHVGIIVNVIGQINLPRNKPFNEGNEPNKSGIDLVRPLLTLRRKTKIDQIKLTFIFRRIKF